MKIVTPEEYNENYNELAKEEIKTTVLLINENLMSGKTLIKLINPLRFDISGDLKTLYRKEGWSDIRICKEYIKIW